MGVSNNPCQKCHSVSNLSEKCYFIFRIIRVDVKEASVRNIEQHTVKVDFDCCSIIQNNAKMEHQSRPIGIKRFVNRSTQLIFGLLVTHIIVPPTNGIADIFDVVFRLRISLQITKLLSCWQYFNVETDATIKSVYGSNKTERASIFSDI